MDPKSGRHMVLALNSVRAPSFFSPKEGKRKGSKMAHAQLSQHTTPKDVFAAHWGVEL